MRSVKNFLTDHWRSQQSSRRGGGTTTASIGELESMSDQKAKPDQIFDQNWALTILELTMNKLGEEMTLKGKGDFFEVGKSLLDGRAVTDGDRAALAHSLQMKDGAFRVALHRMRGRFRQLIQEQVRETVSSEAEFHEEMSYLFRIWS